MATCLNGWEVSTRWFTVAVGRIEAGDDLHHHGDAHMLILCGGAVEEVARDRDIPLLRENAEECERAYGRPWPLGAERRLRRWRIGRLRSDVAHRVTVVTMPTWAVVWSTL